MLEGLEVKSQRIAVCHRSPDQYLNPEYLVYATRVICQLYRDVRCAV